MHLTRIARQYSWNVIEETQRVRNFAFKTEHRGFVQFEVICHCIYGTFVRFDALISSIHRDQSKVCFPPDLVIRNTQAQVRKVRTADIRAQKILTDPPL